MPYRWREKEERNKAIVVFAQAHPDYALSEIAPVFGLSRQRIHQILRRAKKRGNTRASLRRDILKRARRKGGIAQ